MNYFQFLVFKIIIEIKFVHEVCILNLKPTDISMPKCNADNQKRLVKGSNFKEDDRSYYSMGSFNSQ